MFEGHPIYGWPVCFRVCSAKLPTSCRNQSLDSAKVSRLSADIKNMNEQVQGLIHWFSGAFFIYVCFFVVLFLAVFWPLACYGVAVLLGLDPVMADYNCHTWNGICPPEVVKATVLGRRGFYD